MSLCNSELNQHPQKPRRTHENSTIKEVRPRAPDVINVRSRYGGAGTGLLLQNVEPADIAGHHTVESGDGSVDVAAGANLDRTGRQGVVLVAFVA